MARSCYCSTLLRRVSADMSFQALPLAVQGLWLRLMASAIQAAVPGVLRFFPSVSHSVSRVVSLSETETQTHLETLALLGFIELSADGMELSMPGAREAAGRRERAKTNGSGGGRPRKGETAAEAYARRQGHLVLPIQGGQGAAAETQETQIEPSMESSRARPTTLDSIEPIRGEVQSSPVPPPASARVDPTLLGNELAEVLGWDGAKGGFDHSYLRGWLTHAEKRGIPQAEFAEALRDMVNARAERLRGKCRSWGYIKDGVMELIDRLAMPEARQAAQAAASAPAVSTIPPEIVALRRAWLNDGMQMPPPSALLPYLPPINAAAA